MRTAKKARIQLPDIPSKRYFTIGEAAELCGVQPHVLRYWEQEFSQLRPNKRRGNRRYYQEKDILLVRRIRSLLYDEGFTIEGARTRMAEGDSKPGDIPAKDAINKQDFKETISSLREEIQDVLEDLE